MNKHREILENRSRRLTQLVEVSAPKTIISREVMLVIDAALKYCPEIRQHLPKSNDLMRN